MNKLMWILERFSEDIINNWRGITVYVAMVIIILVLGKVLKFYGLLVFYLPAIIIFVGFYGIYKWYDVDYKIQQKQIINKLKGDK